MSFKLVVGIDEDDYIANPDGFVSSDTCRDVMSAFVPRHLGIDYPTEFVSMSVRYPLPIPEAVVGGNVQPKYDLADIYGVPFLLVDSVIKDIDLVCSGDFQDLVCAALVEFLNGRDVSRHKKLFKVVTGKSETEIKEMIDEAQKEKDNFPYVEARIYRALRRADCEDPDAGLKTFPNPEGEGSDITF